MKSWTIDFITEDRRPTAVYRCPCCRTTTYFDLNGSGTVPDPKCCGSRDPFPIEFYEHLKKRPVFVGEPTEGVTDVSAGGMRDMGDKLKTLLQEAFAPRPAQVPAIHQPGSAAPKSLWDRLPLPKWF